MRAFALNHSDSVGGAAKAAHRIHQAVRELGIDSRLLVNHNILDDATINGPKSFIAKKLVRLQSGLGVLTSRLASPASPSYLSPAIFPTNWAKRLNQANADIVHLHWINGEMMSIADIGNIQQPHLWTLHDMWAFSGAEHYPEDLRWQEGSLENNRPHGEGGFDLNRWTWLRKQRNWKNPFQIVTPSHWLARCVQESALMQGWPVEVIPNPLNTDFWRPADKVRARQLLNLPPDVPLILFGAIGGGLDLRKGFDLLLKALQELKQAHSENIKNLELVVFGQEKPRHSVFYGFPIYYTGHIADENVLRLLYSAADLLVVPSRQEIFGQTASEAQACGCPVVAFANTGLSDIVAHKKTGYLAKPLDVSDLAVGICWVLDVLNEGVMLGEAARNKAVAQFGYPVVGAQYKNLYENIIQSM